MAAAKFRLTSIDWRSLARHSGLFAAFTLSAFSFAQNSVADDLDANQDSYEFTVPFEDAGDREIEVVRFRASDKSKTGITLVIYDGYNAMFKAANSSAKLANTGNASVNILLASGNGPAIDVFVGGMQMLPGEGAPLPASQEHREHSYYYTEAMKTSLEQYQAARRIVEN